MRETEAATDLQPARRVSGRLIVVAMFLFGIALTACLWFYWDLHTGPFRPLQDALAAQFPGSSPRVIGGQHKMHKHTPRILRIVMRVDFDPVSDARHGEEMLNAVEAVSRRYVNFDLYDTLELYLFHGVPEQNLREQQYTRQLHPVNKDPRTQSL